MSGRFFETPTILRIPTIFESEFRDKIYHIDFLLDGLTMNDFMKNEDCGCHINNERFSNVYGNALYIKELGLK